MPDESSGDRTGGRLEAGSPEPSGPMRRWQDLTAPEVQSAVEEDPVLVLPLGAVEQHGPHLPLSTDLDIAVGILRRAFEVLSGEVPAWALPPLAVGTSHEHRGFPGTLSLNPETLSDVVVEIGGDLARSGARRLVLLNAHGGNRAVLESAALALRRSHGMLVVKADYVRFPRPPNADLPESEWRRGIHGGAVETAMMLHLRPQAVRRDEIAEHPSLDEELERDLELLRATGPGSFSWVAGDLSESGVVGDARLATPELGSRLVAHYGELLAGLVRDARAFPLSRLR